MLVAVALQTIAGRGRQHRHITCCGLPCSVVVCSVCGTALRTVSLKTELSHRCCFAALQGLPLLVFANKMDLPDALQPAELAEQMQLPQVAQRAFHITSCSALRNEGVQEGMKWLAGQLQLG